MTKSEHIKEFRAQLSQLKWDDLNARTRGKPAATCLSEIGIRAWYRGYIDVGRYTLNLSHSQVAGSWWLSLDGKCLDIDLGFIEGAKVKRRLTVMSRERQGRIADFTEGLEHEFFMVTFGGLSIFLIIFMIIHEATK